MGVPRIPDFDDPRPVFTQIADDLREQIKRGQLRLGTRLPAQTGLAEKYGVAPNTLRAALKELASEGLISTQSTRGTFVLRAPGEPEPSPEYLQAMEQMQALAERMDRIEDRLDGLEDGSRSALQAEHRPDPQGTQGDSTTG